MLSYSNCLLKCLKWDSLDVTLHQHFHSVPILDYEWMMVDYSIGWPYAISLMLLKFQLVEISACWNESFPIHLNEIHFWVNNRKFWGIMFGIFFIVVKPFYGYDNQTHSDTVLLPKQQKHRRGRSF